MKILIGKYKDYIINDYDLEKTYYFNTAGMGAGKSSVCAIASTYFVNEVNKEISNHNIQINYNNHIFNLNKRLVQLFVVPSKQVLISFGKNAANYVSTWLYNYDEINVMFKYTPEYKKGKNNKGHFQYTKEVNSMDISLVDKFLNTILWHKLHRKPKIDKKGNNLWVGGYDYYKPPTVIFCDPKGAEDLIKNKTEFQNKLGWYFLPVVDEWVATIDCNISDENNQYIKSIKNIINSNIKMQFLISASVNKTEIENNEYFNKYELSFAPVVPSTNSLTEMYTYKNELVHPFSKVKFNKINETIDSWDFTVSRCFTPTILIEFSKILNYTIEYNDINNINNYMNTVKNILNIIKNSNDEIKKSICNLKLNNNHNSKNLKTLYLTSSNVSDEILRYIDTHLTKDIILEKINNYKSNIQEQINKLREEIVCSKTFKSKSQVGSLDEINQKIFELEKLLISDEQNYLFSSNFGSATVTKKWIDTWIDILSDNELTVVLSGYDLYFDNRTLDEAIKDVKSEPLQIIDTISSMYGRNDPKVSNVIINDVSNILGFKTMMQGFARAGRSGKHDCVVTTRFNEFLLRRFNCSESKLNQVFNDN